MEAEAKQVNKKKNGKIRRLKLGKALFVLPNLFTLSSVACGFYAITLLARVNTPSVNDLYTCALAIFLAAFFDMFDGRVARMTKTQSEFGVQMDSLADVMSFGVAPALMVYRWGLESYGWLGIFAAFVYVACGAIRLARFNVMAAKQVGPSNYFIGMPIPGGATMVVALIIFHQSYWGGAVQNPGYVALLVITIGLLMVSNVRYRTFKNLRPSPKVALCILILVAIAVGLALSKGVPTAVFTMVASYYAMGILEEIICFKSRRLEKLAAQEAAAAESASAEDVQNAENAQ